MPPSLPKTITLCADDYGYNPAVSLGIRELIRLDRLSAVGCMVNFPHFNSDAKAFSDLQSSTAIGLHFNLTEGKRLSKPEEPFSNLQTLLLKSHFGRLNVKAISQELHAQLDCFVAAFGFMPDFIDGHQHVHQFPQIRQALLQVYQERLHGKPIRSTYPFLSLPKFKMKSALLALSGGFIFENFLNKAAIPHNAFFSGIYNFSIKEDYGTLFRSWLAMAKENTLIMCHPGRANPHYCDPIAASREAELAYLSSPRFLEDCEWYGIIYKPTILKR